MAQLFILGDTSYGADHCDEVNAEVTIYHPFNHCSFPHHRVVESITNGSRVTTNPDLHMQHIGADFLVHYGAATFR